MFIPSTCKEKPIYGNKAVFQSLCALECDYIPKIYDVVEGMYCLQQGMTVDECNALLYKAGEETLTQ